MRRGLAAALLAFVACAPFTGEPGVSSDPEDAAVAKADARASDAAAPEASVGAAFSCPLGALQCEDFTTGFSNEWKTRPFLNVLQAVPDGDPVHGGVAVARFATKTWGDHLEDALGNEHSLDTAALDTATFSIDFLLRIDLLSNGQSVEIAKLVADAFLVHINLNAPSQGSDVTVQISQFSRLRSQEIGTYVTVGKIRDRDWHRIHLELRTSNRDPIQNVFRGGVDGNQSSNEEVQVVDGEATAKTQKVAWVVGLSFAVEFRAETQFAIDEVVVTKQ